MQSMQFAGGHNPDGNDDWPTVLEVRAEDRGPVPKYAWPWWTLFLVESLAFFGTWLTISLLSFGIGLWLWDTLPVVSVLLYIVAGIIALIVVGIAIAHGMYVATEYRLRSHDQRKKYIKEMALDVAEVLRKINPYSLIIDIIIAFAGCVGRWLAPKILTQ